MTPCNLQFANFMKTTPQCKQIQTSSTDLMKPGSNQNRHPIGGLIKFAPANNRNRLGCQQGLVPLEISSDATELGVRRNLDLTESTEEHTRHRPVAILCNLIARSNLLAELSMRIERQITTSLLISGILT